MWARECCHGDHGGTDSGQRQDSGNGQQSYHYCTVDWGLLPRLLLWFSLPWWPCVTTVPVLHQSDWCWCGTGHKLEMFNNRCMRKMMNRPVKYWSSHVTSGASRVCVCACVCVQSVVDWKKHLPSTYKPTHTQTHPIHPIHTQYQTNTHLIHTQNTPNPHTKYTPNTQCSSKTQGALKAERLICYKVQLLTSLLACIGPRYANLLSSRVTDSEPPLDPDVLYTVEPWSASRRSLTRFTRL